MNRFLENLSIQSKLVGIILFSTTLAIVIGFTVTILTDIQTFREDMVNSTLASARLVGHYATPALIFEDRQGAENTIQKLQIIPYVDAVAIYTQDGTLFTMFDQSDDPVPPWMRTEEIPPPVFEGHHLHAYQPIEYENQTYGVIYMKVSTTLLQQKINKYLITMVLIFSALIDLTYLVASWLQTIISKPILDLAGVTERISIEGDYSLRVNPGRTDEIGILYDGFNNMLEQIQLRETQRNEAVEALRESMEKYRGIIENIQDAYYRSDLQGNLTMISPSAARMFGYDSTEEMIGRPIAESFYVHPEERQEFLRLLQETGEVNNYELLLKKTDDTPFTVLANSHFYYNATGNPLGVEGILTNITERKRAEEQVKKDLREKEILLKEIHHRVKNNLQVISSLLNLQSRNIRDEQARAMFRETQNRVRSMALVHEKLYMSKDFSRIDFTNYAKTLVDSLFRTYSINTEKMECTLNVDNVSLSVDLAVPCGLVLNELVSNSLKHAFPETFKRKAKLEIRMHPLENNTIELIVKDNGVGIPKNMDINKTESLGLKLVTILIEDQLQGKIDLDRTKGTQFQIHFHGNDGQKNREKALPSV